MNISKDKNSEAFWIKNGKKRLATLNLSPGFSVYGEKLVKMNGKEYREWNPRRSKIGAALFKGLELPIKKGHDVLYLGAASGTTASHISDIVGEEGKVFCVEISERTIRDLIFVCEKKNNMIPILGDATKPESYGSVIEKVDFVFADVAVQNQAEVFIENCKKFLKKNHYGMIAVKSRSIDVAEKPSKVFEKVEKKLSAEFEIIGKKRLEPFEMDHVAFLVKFS